MKSAIIYKSRIDGACQSNLKANIYEIDSLIHTITIWQFRAFFKISMDGFKL